MTRKATRSASAGKPFTTLQITVLSLIALTLSVIGISASNTDSEIRQPNESLYKNSQTVPLL